MTSLRTQLVSLTLSFVTLDRQRVACRLVALITAFSIGPVCARGVNPSTMSLPRNGKPVAGLTLQVDATWVNNEGYRPVCVTANCAPSNADRTLTIVLRTESDKQEALDSVSENLELAAGSIQKSVTIPVPEFMAWKSLSIAAWEDGRKIDELSGLMVGFDDYRLGGAGTSLLHISDEPVRANLELAFDWSVNSTLQGRLVQHPLADLPDEWINLTSLDCLVISTDALARMSAGRPRVSQAIRDWTAAGGNLCLYGVGQQFERLVQIDRLLSGEPRAGAADSGSAESSWTNPDRALLMTSEEANEDESPAATSTIDIPRAAARTVPKDAMAAQLLDHDPAPFRWRSFRLGRVVAIASENPFPKDDDPAHDEMLAQWSWINASLGFDRLRWQHRHGISYEDDLNYDFWNLMVPGVGLPPLNAYRVLITLFVLLIGPVTYFALNRWQRLYLLLFTVPATAALVTVALLCYALFADGLGVRLRARSYTLLDQPAGEAVTWSRNSYYAGLSPYGGLSFPRDAAVFPFQYSNAPNPGDSEARSTLRDDEQHLTRGWLRSRIPTQYIVLRSGSERKRLAIEPVIDKLKVTNHLGNAVRQAVIAGAGGKLYYVKHLAMGETSLVEPLPNVAGAAPVVPVEFHSELTRQHQIDSINDPSRSGTSPLLGIHSHARHQIQYGNTGSADVDQSTSLLEMALKECAARFTTGAPTGLPAGTYVAIVEDSDPELRGMASAVEEGSLHVIEGKW